MFESASARGERVQELFLAAVGIVDTDERAAFLRGQCADDSALLREVESLVALDCPNDDFLETPIRLRSMPSGVAAQLDMSLGDQQARSTESESCLPLIPGYEVLRVLGRGGMGVVYQARQAGLKRLVALKMILAGAHASPDQVGRFRAEAEAVARLQHPNIVQIYEIGEQGGLPFLSLEFVDGGSLESKLAGNAQNPRAAAELVQTLARAMHMAHQAGIIHRDLKPANVLLTKDGKPKITDFGLAKQLDASARLTQSGAIMGTPSYMAPEQAAGKTKEIGPATDVYALGTILYEMLTGRPPFKAETPMDTLMQVMEDEPVSLLRLRRKLPRDLETICLKCLQKEPSRRYVTAADLADELGRFLRRESIRARPVGPVQRSWRWCKRKPLVAGLTAAVAVSLLTGILVASYFAIQANKRAQETAQRLYISDMRLAQRAWDDANISLLLDLLEGQRPENTGGIDLRGFEWHYWWRLCHSDLLTLGHTSAVGGVTFSPDGTRLASGGDEGQIRLWNAQNGKPIPTTGAHRKRVTSLAWSPDGALLASGSSDNTVKLWNAQTGEELRTIQGHRGGVTSVVFSLDGKRVASCGDDNCIKLWNIETIQNVKAIRTIKNAHEGHGIVCIALSPDGRTLASGGRDQRINLWNSDNGSKIDASKGHDSDVTTVAFSPDGRILASGSLDGNIRLWDVHRKREIFMLMGHTQGVHAVAFSPDCRRVASASRDSMLKVWDVHTGQEILTLKGHTASVAGVAFSPDGRRLASASDDKTVKVWNVWTSQEGLVLKGHIDVQSVAFSGDGLRLVSGSDDKTVKLWNPQLGLPIRMLRGHTKGIRSVVLSPDGRRLASSGEEGEIGLWNARSGEPLQTIPAHRKGVRSLAWSPDGKLLASGSEDSTVKLWNAQTGQEIRPLKGHRGEVTSVAFSPDGQRLASGSRDKTAKIWDIQAGHETLSFDGHAGEVLGVAFSPDGTRLATASEDSAVKLWDAYTGKERHTLKGHTELIRTVAFSPDGRRLATGSHDSTVKLWDAETGQEVLTLMTVPKTYTNWVVSVVFSPDGWQLAAGCYNGTVRLWDARDLKDDVSVDHEAAGLLEFLLSQGIEKEEVLARLGKDQTIGDAVRARALSALEDYQDDPYRFHRASLEVTWLPHLPCEYYCKALRQADRAIGLWSENGHYLNTLGMAQFRVGDYEQAVKTLTRAEKLGSARFGPSREGLACLAMAYRRLGDKKKAQDTFGRLQKSMEEPYWKRNFKAQSLSGEAKLLIQPGGSGGGR